MRKLRIVGLVMLLCLAIAAVTFAATRHNGTTAPATTQQRCPTPGCPQGSDNGGLFH